MALEIKKLTNANVFVNGNSLLGKVEEATLPEITAKTTEHMALGMIGTVETPAGFEAMEAELKWTSFYADTMREVGDPTKALQMSLRGSIEKFESSGRTSQEAYVVYLTGMPKSFPTGTFVAHDNATFSSKFSINAIKIEVAGAVVLEFDAFANIYKVNGVDVYATYNQNIGA